MKHSSSTIEQALWMADSGLPASEICRHLKISDTTFYNWKAKFHGLNSAGIDLCIQMAQENRTLKRQLDRLQFEKQALQSLITDACSETPGQELIHTLMNIQPITEQQARTLLTIK